MAERSDCDVDEVVGTEVGGDGHFVDFVGAVELYICVYVYIYYVSLGGKLLR